MKNKELREKLTLISKLEKERDVMCKKVIKECYLPLSEWIQFELSEDELRETLLNFFAEHELLYHGLKNFTNTVEALQPRLEAFLIKELRKNKKFLYSPYYKRLFKLKKVEYKSTSRSKNIIEKYSIDEDGHLVYEYNGTTFHGFGSIDDNVTYELVIDIDNNKVVSVDDSTLKYYTIPWAFKSLPLSIEFLNGLCV